MENDGGAKLNPPENFEMFAGHYRDNIGAGYPVNEVGEKNIQFYGVPEEYSRFHTATRENQKLKKHLDSLCRNELVDNIEVRVSENGIHIKHSDDSREKGKKFAVDAFPFHEEHSVVLDHEAHSENAKDTNRDSREAHEAEQKHEFDTMMTTLESANPKLHRQVKANYDYHKLAKLNPTMSSFYEHLETNDHELHGQLEKTHEEAEKKNDFENLLTALQGENPQLHGQLTARYQQHKLESFNPKMAEFDAKLKENDPKLHGQLEEARKKHDFEELLTTLEKGNPKLHGQVTARYEYHKIESFNPKMSDFYAKLKEEDPKLHGQLEEARQNHDFEKTMTTLESRSPQLHRQLRPHYEQHKLEEFAPKMSSFYGKLEERAPELHARLEASGKIPQGGAPGKSNDVKSRAERLLDFQNSVEGKRLASMHAQGGNIHGQGRS